MTEILGRQSMCAHIPRLPEVALRASDGW